MTDQANVVPSASVMPELAAARSAVPAVASMCHDDYGDSMVGNGARITSAEGGSPAVLGGPAEVSSPNGRLWRFFSSIALAGRWPLRRPNSGGRVRR